MKKMMVYLPDEVHEGLRRLAFEHRTSIAELIRRAVDATYGEILEDIRDMEGHLGSYRANPSSAISLDDFLAELKRRAPRHPRTRRTP